MVNPPPQPGYYDDQDTFNVDFDQLYDSFIIPIDNIRSHYNALAPNSQELNTPQYQESRCHAFFRMIGFPIVADDSNFHSPGFDPNLNIDSTSSMKYSNIDALFIANNVLTGQTASREQVPIDFSKIFSNGGINAQAVALGSIFVRSFDKQFSNPAKDPLVVDPSQQQTIPERIAAMAGPPPPPAGGFYAPGGFTNAVIPGTTFHLLLSRHFLKPFIVDPRIDGYVKPIKNKICAPFLLDKSQTKIFQSSNGTSDNLLRPYLEKVISTRYNNTNVTAETTAGGAAVQKIVDQIISDDMVTDKQLIDTTKNALKVLYSDQLQIYNNYFKIIRVIIDTLVDDIKNVQYIRAGINFNPIPSPKTGVEGGTNGGQLASPPFPGDPLFVNNRKGEKNLIDLMQKQALNTLNLDTGTQGMPDPGDFVFSNINDTVFSVNTVTQQSYEDNITQLTNLRNQAGNSGIDSLRNIEIIMGEFSGIGLIDMIAIQAALWIMPGNSLLGLIDQRAYGRITPKLRPDINLNGASQNPIMLSLKDFESSLTTTYLLIQAYYNSIYDGSASSAPGTT